MVKIAFDMAEQGFDGNGIMSHLESLVPKGRVLFLVETLDYLQKGGRIGAASALLGTALQIKPILCMRDGRIGAFEKVRTHRRAYERRNEISRYMIDDPESAYLSVGHADHLVDAQQLAVDLESIFDVTDIPIYHRGASITTHAGPGVLKIALFSIRN